MERYRSLVQKAVARTEEWGLRGARHSLVKHFLTLPREEPICLNKIAKRAVAKMSSSLPVPAEIRSNLCAHTHARIAGVFMSMGWGVAPFVTIGDVLVEGESCFQVSEDSLRSTLAAGRDLTSTIRIHAWLTFPDFTILDLTLVPWLYRQEGKPPQVIPENEITIFETPSRLREKFDYRPMLVGTEFLWATAAASEEDRAFYEHNEREWLEHFAHQINRT